MANSTVIIPTKNRPQLLHQCLQALSGQDLKPSEVLIIDNSPKQTAKVVADYWSSSLAIVYYSRPHFNLAQLRNWGIKKARHATIVFLDDDHLPQAEWLKKLTSQLSHQRFAVVTGFVENAYPDSLVATVQDYYLQQLWQSTITPDAKGITAQLCTGNMGFNREQLPNLTFDQSLPFTHEDIDLDSRLRLANKRIAYLPELTVRHYGRTGLANFWRWAWRTGQGRYHYQRKWSQLYPLMFDSNHKQQALNKSRNKYRSVTNRLNKEWQQKKILWRLGWISLRGLYRLANWGGYNWEKYFYDNIQTSRA